MAAGLERIHAIADALDAVVVPGHDGRTREEFPALDGAARGVAVRLA